MANEVGSRRTASWERGYLRGAAGEAGRNEMSARLFEFGTYFMLRAQLKICSDYSHLSPKGARVPAPDQTPSTHAPFLPITASTKRSSSWSYSILA